MKSSGLLDRRFLIALAVAGGILVILVIASLLVKTTAVSDIGAVLCSALSAVLFVRAWLRMSGQDLSKRVWGLVALGAVLWAVAEAVWGFYDLVLRVEIPYPSVADIFWLVGYAMLYVALIVRSRSLAVRAVSPTQKTTIGGFILLYSLVVVVLIARPLAESFDVSRFAESVVNTAYPLADWGLCGLTLIIIFSLERGRFATTWHLFGAGLLLMATADLLFFYADWNGLYYPGGHLNLISGLLDLLFNLSYLTMGLAIYAYGLLSQSISSGDIHIVLKSPASMDVLIFVGAQGRILSVSDNFMNLMHAPETKPYIGMDLGKALGLDDAHGAELISHIERRDALRNQPLAVHNKRGEMQQTFLNSLVMLNERGVFDMVAIVLRTSPPAPGETEYPLQEDQKMLIRHYLEKSGASLSRESDVLRAYFVAQLNLLYSLIQQFSGNAVAGRLLDQLAQMARMSNLQFSYTGHDISLPVELEGRALQDVLMPLLQEARRFTADMTSGQMVDQEIRALDGTLDADTAGVLARYGVQPGLMPAAV